MFAKWLSAQNVPRYEIKKWSCNGRNRNWMYIYTHTVHTHTPQLDVPFQGEQISRRGELSMEEKRKAVTYVSGSPRLLSEFSASFTPFNSGEEKKQTTK